MPLETSQVRCPYCNAAQMGDGAGQYTCEFCLQPFTTVDAHREESRLVEEIKKWVQQRVGSAAGGTTVDASSREFIFRQKVLPDLKREVDRALETVGAFGQFPLVLPPIPRAPNRAGPSPFVSMRGQIPILKSLRVRLESEQVAAFAVTDPDRAAIASLDNRLAQLLHLFHVTGAASGQKPEGYAASRKNLEALIEECGKHSDQPVDRRAYLLALQERYRALADACRLFEQIQSAPLLSGETAAQQAEAIAERLSRAAAAVEGSNWSPAEAMPTVIGVQAEAESCRSLAQWLRAYDGLCSGRQISFPAFAAKMEGSLSGGLAELGKSIEWVVTAVRASRGEIAVGVIDDFSWVASWSEQARSRKALGLFGVEEKIAQIEQFLVPAWLAELTLSRSTGAIFKSGAEFRTLALVTACSPSPEKVRVLGQGDDRIVEALTQPRPINAGEFALPNSSPEVAQAIFTRALRARPDMLNASATVKGMVFLPAAVVHYQSKTGTREHPGCLGGQVSIDGNARVQLQQARILISGLK